MGPVTRIADAVHGTVELTPVESAVVSTRAYQRMRGVKHLGLASLAFPGADYSRFAHGVGTLHVTGLILANLRRNVEGSLSDGEVRLYRMAALLHDIGHYPFSHTFEHALRDHYSQTNILKPTGGSADGSADGLSEGIWLHEELGTRVILDDAELNAVLVAEGIDVEALTGIIVRSNPPKFANLVSSDLDADRTDYLMRTAVHTGLPYGNVDLPYLLSQIRLDKDKHVAFTAKGMRAAEHLLLSRYFDYQQVSYHKTVAGLELVLNDAVGALLRTGRITCTPAVLTAMIEDGRWYSFDDAFITAHMREAADAGDTTEQDRLLYSSILNRNPPKLLADREVLGAPASHGRTFASLVRLARDSRDGWAARFGCPVYVWSKATGLTKIGSRVAVSALPDDAEDETYDKVQQAVHILVEDGTSIPIQEHERSLISVLSEHNLYSLRVYALLPRGREGERAAISAEVNTDLGGFLAPQ